MAASDAALYAAKSSGRGRVADADTRQTVDRIAGALDRPVVATP
jgi:hypothetical protein